MAYIYDIADTWSGGGAFTGIKLNVTDGGSTAGSLLMDLQVGGSSKFSVTKGGALTVGVNSSSARSLIFTTVNLGNEGFSATANEIGLWANGSGAFAWKAGSYMLGSGLELSWSNSSSPIGNAADVRLFRDAANTLAQRNGVNAQAFNLYQSYTDASNYTRGRVAAASGIVTIAGESAGTGAADIDIALTPKGTGRVRYGTHAAIAAETVTGYIEIKDAGGTVRKIAVVS